MTTKDLFNLIRNTRKICVAYDEDDHLEVYGWDGVPCYNLYYGIDVLEYGALLETEGDPCTLGELEESDYDSARELAADVNAIIANDGPSYSEPINFEDFEYLMERLPIYGIDCESISETDEY